MQQLPSIDQLLDLVETEAWPQLRQQLVDCHPVDIAELITQSPEAHHARLFGLIPEPLKPDVLAELEAVAGAEILEVLTNSEISDIVEDMAPDDAADVLAELPGDRFEKVLALMEKDESDDVRKLMQYKDDTAGGIMTTDVVSMHGQQTVGEAIEAIAHLDTREKFTIANIVDTQGILRGHIDIWDLLRERNRQRPLAEMAQPYVAMADVNMDQENVAQLMQKYDLGVLPVVDGTGRLVGRITADDVIDVIEEEASEDIFRLAGSDDAELESSSPLHSCKVRLPWLLVTLLGGFVTTLILDRFQSHVAGLVVLIVFVPILLAMGGNTGIQSSTLVVRSLALGALNRRRVLQLLVKEVLTGAIMGGICGTIIGLWAGFVVTSGDATALHLPVPPIQLALAVATALFSAMTFATAFGALVPIALDRLGIDPAVASGPFITIANDIAALLIYFGVTTLLLSGVV
ncbi:MAG: magnesium transporter [Verrucomicrobia bacterium]|nr:magnesium transporter [Verrucomicrobiota bacterium]